MLTIDGQPLLDIWLDAFANCGVTDVLINLHHLPHVVRRHLEMRTGPPSTCTVYEPQLLGSAGTLAANRNWVDGEELFLVSNADNLTDYDLRHLVEAHRHNHAIATLTLFRSQQPSTCGIVDVSDGRVVGYVEKPKEPRSDLANAGIYAFDRRVLDEIQGRLPQDIGYDLLPRLVGQARVTMIDGYFRDIGTPEAYRRAQEEWCSRTRR